MYADNNSLTRGHGVAMADTMPWSIKEKATHRTEGVQTP